MKLFGKFVVCLDRAPDREPRSLFLPAEAGAPPGWLHKGFDTPIRLKSQRAADSVGFANTAALAPLVSRGWVS